MVAWRRLDVNTLAQKRRMRWTAHMLYGWKERRKEGGMDRPSGGRV